MQKLVNTLSHGLRSASHIPTLLPLWISNLILGLLQTWPLWLAGGQALQRPFLSDFASGGNDTLVNLALRNDALTMQAPIWAGMLVPVFIIQHIIYAICAGGMLTVYLGKGTFGQGSKHFALAFIGLDLLLTILIALGIGAIALGVGLGGGPWLIPGLLIIIALGVLGEYARAIAIVRDRRNPFALLGQAFGFCIRHFAGVALLALLSGIVLLVFLVGYSAIPKIAATPWLAVIFQQVLILALFWLKALRLAWAGHYVQQNAPVETPNLATLPAHSW